MRKNILYIENGFYSTPLIKDMNNKPKKYAYIKDILKDIGVFYDKNLIEMKGGK